MRLYGVFLVLDLMLIVIVIIVSVLGIFKTELGILEPELAMIIITAAFGIGGWLFTAHQSQIQRQKQNALDVLLQHRLSDTFDRHHSRVYKKLLSIEIPEKNSRE